MAKDPHFTSLENMYLSAPINQWYKPSINITEAEAEISIELEEKYFHAAGATHGSVYFKLLDDAAFFAANSLEHDQFVLTTAFTTYITKPVSSGKMTAIGKVVNKNKSQFVVEAVAYNDDGQEIARGNGLFVRGKFKLKNADGYGS
ncbi:MAG: PaaI family thioesterase [Gammaproteobacteria bacterium]|nr:PaaI family thioesterase [Gammaproteobacteria bacterium]MDH5630472.1 PaaI family thioesterase [Gammaproteobacteria bacterium]